MTAAQLADELEVSVRTVYRDVEALHTAGIPLYGDAGHAGGYRLLDGYRTRLTGLTAPEAEAIFLAGAPGPAADLGLGPVLAAAQLKVRAALPAELRPHADRVGARFHLDAPGWYARADEVPHLSAVADAVWNSRVLQVRYRRWRAPTEVDRRLRPYGLVLKAGRWYVIAAATESGEPRTYRVDQILQLAAPQEQFTIPSGFDLAAYWQSYQEAFHARLHQGDAVVRLAPHAVSRLSGPAARAAEATGVTEPDGDGWIRAALPIESVGHAHDEFLRLGADVEVLEPPELRAELASTAAALHARYHGTSPSFAETASRLAKAQTVEQGGNRSQGPREGLTSSRPKAAAETMAHDHEHGHNHGHGHGHHHEDIHWATMGPMLERHAQLAAPQNREIAAWLRTWQPEPALIADVGGGSGSISFLLSEIFPKADVITVDPAEPLLERARERAAREGLTDRVTTLHAELPEGIGELPHADLLWIGRALHHVGDQEAALAALADRLAPGGAIALLEGGLNQRSLPRDIGFGRPGLQTRFDAADDQWFTQMRAELPGAKAVTEDWPRLLTEAGLRHGGTRSFLLDLPSPVSDTARAHLVTELSRRREMHADTLDADDLATVDRLMDPNDEQSLHHRPDVFLLSVQTVHVGVKE